MKYVVFGALGAILVLVLFAAGIYVGYKIQARLTQRAAESQPKPNPETPEEAERRRLIEDQNAFRIQMGYTPEMAYGMMSASDVVGGKESEG